MFDLEYLCFVIIGTNKTYLYIQHAELNLYNSFVIELILTELLRECVK